MSSGPGMVLGTVDTAMFVCVCVCAYICVDITQAYINRLLTGFSAPRRAREPATGLLGVAR